MSESLPAANEHRLIAKIAEWANSSHIGDDCAILGGQTLASVDSLVEGTHFRLTTTSLADLGWKSVAVNLSDIAAMAGRPRYILVSIGMPEYIDEAGLEQLYRGISDCASQYRVKVVGGDLTKSSVLFLSITVIGSVHEEGRLERNGARAGDVVIVTGDFGASAAGLDELSRQSAAGQSSFTKSQSNYLTDRHRRPLPRLCESWALVRKSGSRGALMDASDGLADALVQICRASSEASRHAKSVNRAAGSGRPSAIGMSIDIEKVPVHQETVRAAREAGVDPLDWVLYGGEDYELVACVEPGTWERLKESQHNPFAEIGTVTDTGRIAFTRGGKQDAGLSLTLEKCYQHLE